MNGIHDLGGMHGMGPTHREENEPVFHEEWERRVFGMLIATWLGGHFNGPQFRHAIENMDSAHYLASSYYEHWLAALQALLIADGSITEEELETRMAELAKEVS